MNTREPHPRLLCIWLPNWPIQRIGAAEPQLAKSQLAKSQLANKSLVLSTRDARRGLVVAAVNLAGRQAGIRPNMRLSEATALVETEIREYDPHEDMDVLCSLAEQAQQFSPLVGLEQLDKKLWAGRTRLQPECLLLDVTGIPKLFGGEAALLEEISQWLARQNYFGCLGLANSVGAAWALANYGTRRQPATNASAAATSSDIPAPTPLVPACRFCVAPAEHEWSTLSELPVSALRLEQTTVQSLVRLGIRRIGQLEQLPRAGLATRLGDQLLKRWDQAAARHREPVVSLHSAPDWSLEQTLEYPTQNRETIAELVKRLSRELAARLNRRGEGALRVVCRMDLVEAAPLVLQLGLFRPTNDAEHVELLLTGQLEQQFRNGLACPLWRLSLQATLTAPIAWRQIDLFDAGETAHRQQIARLVDTLSSRLGRKQVLGAKVCRDAQPELAYSWQPLTGRRQDGTPQATHRKLSSRLAHQRAEPLPEDPWRRPTHLLSPPVEIEVAATPSHTYDHPQPAATLSLASHPSRFHYQGRWLEIIAFNGPERLESGWWRGPSARRDYYRVITSQGEWWWIYRDLNSGTWYMHGLFD
jgi:protein ImuB